MPDVNWSGKAIELLESLDSEVEARIIKKLDEARNWPEHRLERLSGYSYYKLRIGDYRAIIDWDQEEDVLTVLVVGHRRNIYKRYLSS